MRLSLRKILFLALGLALLVVLFYYSRNKISVPNFSWKSFGATVLHARKDLILLTIISIYACYFLRAMRWVRFARYLGPASLWRVFEATLMGFAAMFLLGRPGEPVRPLLIARREKLSVSSMFGIYVIERVFDIAATIIFASTSLVFLPTLLAEHGGGGGSFLPLLRRGGALLLAGLLAAIAFLFYLRFADGGVVKRSLDGWRGHPGWRARAAGLFAGFVEGLQAIRSLGDLTAATLLSAVHWTLIVFIYHWVLASLRGQLAALDLRAAELVLACTMLGSTVQIPAMGGGSQVASFLALTVFLGVKEETAAAAAILLWLVTFASCSLTGIPLLIREGMSLGELRRIAREERAAEAAGTHLADGKKPEGAAR